MSPADCAKAAGDAMNWPTALVVAVAMIAIAWVIVAMVRKL